MAVLEDSSKVGPMTAVQTITAGLSNFLAYFRNPAAGSQTSRNRSISGEHLAQVIASVGGMPVAFSTSVDGSNPGTGKVALNQSVQNTTTSIYLHPTDAFSRSWAELIVTAKSLRLAATANPDKWLNFKVRSVTTLSGYYRLDGIMLGSSAASPFANNADLVITIRAGMDFNLALSDQAAFADLDPGAYSGGRATANTAAFQTTITLGSDIHGRVEVPRIKAYVDQLSFGQDHSDCYYNFSRGCELINRGGYIHVISVDCYQIVSGNFIYRIGYGVGVSITNNNPIPHTFTAVDISGGDPTAISVGDLIYFGNYYNYQGFANVQAATLTKVTAITGGTTITVDGDGVTVPQSSAILLDVTVTAGAVTAITVRSGSDQGHIYADSFDNPVVITGAGTGATAHLTVVSNVVTGVVVTAGGSGYIQDTTEAIAPTPYPYAKYIRGGKRIASKPALGTVRMETHADAALGTPGRYAALIRGVIWAECALSMHKIYAVNASTGDVSFETAIADEDWIEGQMCLVFDPPQNMTFDGAKIGGTSGGGGGWPPPAAYTVFIRAAANVTLENITLTGGDSDLYPGQFHVCSSQYVTLKNCDGLLAGNACSDLTVYASRLRGWETHASVRRVRIYGSEIDNSITLFSGSNDILFKDCVINAIDWSTGEMDKVILDNCRIKGFPSGGVYWNGTRCEWKDTKVLSGVLTIYVQAGCKDWVLKRNRGVQFIMDAGSTGAFEDVIPAPVGDLSGWNRPILEPANIGVQTLSRTVLSGTYATDVGALQELFDAVLAKKLVVPFSPTLVPGIFFWLRPGVYNYQLSTGVTAAIADNDPVGFVTDLTNQGNNVLQATSGQRALIKTAALNGHSVWELDGVDDFWSCVNALNVLDGPWWAFAIVKPANTAGHCIIGATTTGHSWFLNGGTNVQALVRTNQLGIAVGSAAISTSAYSIVGVRYTGSSTNFYLNGAADGSPTAGAGGFSNPSVSVGAEVGGAVPFSGRRGDVLLGSGNLSDSDAAKIQEFLNAYAAIY